MGKTLRVLNGMHHYEVGIPITLTQYVQSHCSILSSEALDRYNYISPDQLLARLTSRSLHLLALRVAGHLSIKPDGILKHWACAKIARSKPSAGITAGEDGDDEVCRLIVEKFETMGGGGSGVSYAEIAKRAWEIGRTGLATKVCTLPLKVNA
jgi:vacuolar protein sorting-associated protein 16